MDLDDIESEYRINVEKEDEAFLKNLSNAKDKNEKAKIEETYHKNLKLLLEEYRKNVSGFLGRKDVELFEKDEVTEEEKKNVAREKFFSVRSFNFRTSRSERLRIWWKVFKFRSGINIKKFVYRITPSFLIILFYEVKFTFISFYLDSKFIVQSLLASLRKISVKIFEAIRSLLVKLYTLLKGMVLYVFKKLSRSSDKDSDKEKKGKEAEGKEGKPAPETKK